MFCISSAPQDKIMSVHIINCIVATIFATDIIEKASNIIGDDIPIKAETCLMFAGVGSSMNR